MFVSLLVTIALIALDQFTKYLATAYLAPVGTLPFIPGVMELRFVLNDGAAFSMLSGNRWFLIVVTGIALVVLAGWLFVRKPVCLLERAALILILAGGLGNFIDRVKSGIVVDFFATTFMNFAVFNVADCFVCIGVGLLVLFYIRQELALKKEKEAGHDQA